MELQENPSILQSPTINNSVLNIKTTSTEENQQGNKTTEQRNDRMKVRKKEYNNHCSRGGVGDGIGVVG